jgi:hypothetical protein
MEQMAIFATASTAFSNVILRRDIATVFRATRKILATED